MMNRPQRASPWTFLCILACLLVLSMASPRLWDAPQHQPNRNIIRAASLGPQLPPPPLPAIESAKDRPLPALDGVAEEDVPVAAENEQRQECDDVAQADDAFVTAICPLPDSALEPIPEEEQSDSHVVVKTEEPIASPADSPQPVQPEGKVAAQVTEPVTPKEPPTSEKPTILSESIRRLPELLANIPSAIRAAPHDELQPSDALVYPDTSRMRANEPLPERRPVQLNADDSWREPETLLESLNELASARPTSQWAADVERHIRTLGRTVANGSNEAAAVLERLADLDRQAPELAAKLSDRSLARKLKQTGYALSRRLDVWQEVVRLGAPQPAEPAAPAVDAEKLAFCLAEIDAATSDSPEGQAWRNYLLVDTLRDCSKRQPSPDDVASRRLAQQVLARLTQTPLTPHQQSFVSSGPVAALRAELKHWAAEPIGAAAVLRDLERYERTGLPSDARRLALDCQYLALAPIEARRELADRVDTHYRNANLRFAMTEELCNKLIPERNLEYAHVDDTVLGVPVSGESLMASEVALRMQPDPNRVRIALEVTGEIAASTIADSGPARLHNDSQSTYIARKPMEIDMKGISLWPTEVGVYNQTQLNGVETSLDGIPLISAIARGVAKSQAEQSKPAANREVKEKIAAQARERVNAEARKFLTEVVAHMNQRVFDPLNSLSLDPELIAAETTEKRFTMRLRLAGEDQLGSHTPRPQAIADSLASVQVHESAIDNGIQRLLLNGRTFTLPALSQYVATRLNRPTPWDTDPDQADVKITFAEKDAVLVRCQNNRVAITLSIAQLSKGPRKWKNFQVRAFYRPEVNGRSAVLVRDGVIQLPSHVSTGAQLALRGIFSHAFSKDRTFELVPEQIIKEPKLSDAAITQFVIDDGWVGISLGPKSSAVTTARRPRSAPQ
jgi:hypothetical protein